MMKASGGVGICALIKHIWCKYYVELYSYLLCSQMKEVLSMLHSTGFYCDATSCTTVRWTICVKFFFPARGYTEIENEEDVPV